MSFAVEHTKSSTESLKKRRRSEEAHINKIESLKRIIGVSTDLIICGRIGCIQRKNTAGDCGDWCECECCGEEVCPTCVSSGIAKSGCLCEYDE